MPTTQLILTPARAATPIEGGSVDLLVRVLAPAAPQTTLVSRPQLRLALVIDRSGSMDGQPLAEAIRCAQNLIARLQPSDEVAVVLYDDQVSVPIPMQPVRGVASLATDLSTVLSGGSTALHAGWTEGLRQLCEARPGTLNRVVLLSDGQANRGPTSLEDFDVPARQAAARGVSTTTVGLGRGFNETLMIGLAEAGGGQTYYGETATDLADAFDEEFALLEALCARQIRVHLTPAPGVQFTVLSEVQRGDGWIALPDLAFGAEAWALIRLHISTASGAEVDRRHLLTARVEGLPQAGVTIDGIPARLDLAGLPQALIDQEPEDPLVLERRAEVLFGQALKAVHTALRGGSRREIEAAMLRAQAMASGQPWLEAKLEHLKAMVIRDEHMAMKEARFSSKRINSRLVANESVQFSLDETAQADLPAFLRRKVGEGKGTDKGVGNGKDQTS